MNFLTGDLMATAELTAPDPQENEWVFTSASSLYKPIEETGPLSISYYEPHNLRQQLRYYRQLSKVLRNSSVTLPDSALQISQNLLESVVEFKPHRMGMSIVVDEDEEASLVLTAYWPTGTLHIEHFYHFPADDPEDTIVNFYGEQEGLVAPQHQWGWYSPVQEFGTRLQKQLRNGQWPLKQGW